MAGADIAIDVIAAQMATQNMVNGSDPAQQIVNAAQGKSMGSDSIDLSIWQTKLRISNNTH